MRRIEKEDERNGSCVLFAASVAAELPLPGDRSASSALEDVTQGARKENELLTFRGSFEPPLAIDFAFSARNVYPRWVQSLREKRARVSHSLIARVRD